MNAPWVFDAGRYAHSTKGPWMWKLDLTNRDVQILGGVPKYDLTVIDFVRWGMNSAAPRFREDVAGMNIMHRCDEHAQVVPGREHHSHWFQTLDHPDARLIADAPLLLAELQRALQNEREGWDYAAQLEATRVEQEAEIGRLKEIVSEFVACRALHDEILAGPKVGELKRYNVVKAEFYRREPAALKSARAALAAQGEKT